MLSKNFTCSDNRMNYMKGKTFNKSRDLGDLNMWLLNFTFSFNHIDYLKKNVRRFNDRKVLKNCQNLFIHFHVVS